MEFTAWGHYTVLHINGNFISHQVYTYVCAYISMQYVHYIHMRIYTVHLLNAPWFYSVQCIDADISDKKLIVNTITTWTACFLHSNFQLQSSEKIKSTIYSKYICNINLIRGLKNVHKYMNVHIIKVEESA